MHAFVTGGNGFAGTWLCEHLVASGDTVAVSSADINDLEELQRQLVSAAPEVVFHLAGQANVGKSWDDPASTFHVNAAGTLSLMTASLRLATPPRVVVIGSAEVYGSVQPADLPVAEDRLVRPTSPYAASKAAAEIIAIQAFLGSGLHTVVARSFNHIGPGQAPTFVVSALAHRVAEARRAGVGSISVGNLTPRRDFTDVRDVARAYRLLAEHGHPGEVYNVCSGESFSVAEIAATLVHLDVELESEAGRSAIPLELIADPALQRAVDVPELRGNPGKISADCGWSRTLSIRDTLREVLVGLRK
jgi:GDP-4-dehydro-6-deoxy-D-mannose reductase